jgi:hypothetical protein
VPQQLPDSSPVLMPPPRANQYSSNELIDAGHHFFGGISRGLALIVGKAVSQWGLPNGYILGEEASGAFIGGLRYGEGRLYTKNAGDMRVFWQGPSLGFDAGADGARTMMLVYNLPRTEAIFDRFGGICGLGLFRRRPRHDGADRQRYCRGSDPFRTRAAARSQHWLSQIHGTPDLEPVLTTQLAAKRRSSSSCFPPPWSAEETDACTPANYVSPGKTQYGHA